MEVVLMKRSFKTLIICELSSKCVKINKIKNLQLVYDRISKSDKIAWKNICSLYGNLNKEFLFFTF